MLGGGAGHVRGSCREPPAHRASPHLLAPGQSLAPTVRRLCVLRHSEAQTDRQTDHTHQPTPNHVGPDFTCVWGLSN